MLLALAAAVAVVDEFIPLGEAAMAAAAAAVVGCICLNMTGKENEGIWEKLGKKKIEAREEKGCGRLELKWPNGNG